MPKKTTKTVRKKKLEKTIYDYFSERYESFIFSGINKKNGDREVAVKGLGYIIAGLADVAVHEILNRKE